MERARLWPPYRVYVAAIPDSCRVLEARVYGCVTGPGSVAAGQLSLASVLPTFAYGLARPSKSILALEHETLVIQIGGGLL